jgi:ComF family protein
MGRRMARLAWPEDVLRERAALVPVPLAPARERERGYNQAELLARAVAAAWALPVWRDVLFRVRATPSQTRLTPEERLRNVAGAFHAPPAARDRLRGTHLVLVDDVVTTAATLNACAAALAAGGARITSYVTFARAPAAGDPR